MFREAAQDLFASLESIQIDPWLVEIPQDRSLGDFALPCFSFAKELKKSPQDIATEIASQLAPNDKIAKIEALGPYINVTLHSARVTQQTITTVLEQWGDYWAGERRWKTILVEWRSPNTHKMLHVGHLRNALVSETVCTISEFAGYDVIRTAYGGDIGAHVAKWVWYFKNFVTEEYPQDPQEFMTRSWRIYQEASLKASEDDKHKDQIHEVQRLLESWDKELNDIWQETRELSIAWLQSIFDELGCTIQRFYRESEVEQPGIDLVKQYESDEKIKNIRMSEWAIIADLEEYDLWVFLLLKSNGTSLYSTKDVALAHLKEEEYVYDESVYVVATEQNLHFQQLFKTLELAGFDIAKLKHLWYELVELPDGKMSSRAGTVIPYQVRRDNAISTAKWLLTDRDIQNKDQIAEMVAFAALKFSMLLQDTYKKIRLDMWTALSFEWETGPYLQYTYARCGSVLRKAKYNEGMDIDYSLLTQDNERLLCLRLSEFADTVAKAADEYKPSLVARYILELTREFNSYYHDTKILVDDDAATSEARLTLVRSVQQVLKTGLWLLWIQAPEKM